MKCQVLWLDRARAKLFKKASYDACAGKIKRGFRESVNFYIPDKAIPLELEGRITTKVLWIVNAKTGTALSLTFTLPQEEESEEKHRQPRLVKEGEIKEEKKALETLSIVEKTDVDAHIKLNLLSKKEFWKQVAEKIKLSLVETLIYLGAGYGFLRLAEYIVTAIFFKK